MRLWFHNFVTGHTMYAYMSTTSTQIYIYIFICSYITYIDTHISCWGSPPCRCDRSTVIGSSVWGIVSAPYTCYWCPRLCVFLVSPSLRVFVFNVSLALIFASHISTRNSLQASILYIKIDVTPRCSSHVCLQR